MICDVIYSLVVLIEKLAFFSNQQHSSKGFIVSLNPKLVLKIKIKGNFWIRTFKQKFNKIFDFHFDFENQFLKLKFGDKNKDSLSLIVSYVIIMSILKINTSSKIKFN